MKYRNIKLFFPIVSFVLALSMTSCVNDLNVQNIDPNVVPGFQQDEVIAKIYASLALTGQEGPAGNGEVKGIDEGTSAFIRLIWNLNELTTDEAMCSWGDPGIPEMNYNKWTSSHDQIKGLYGRLYFDITLCNTFLQQTTGLTDDKSKKQRAEARFMRALNYYYLLDMFGNVPFSETVTIGDAAPQIKRVDLFKYVEKELIECEADMYEPKTAPYYRADKAANWLLRSRLYLNSEIFTTIPETSATLNFPATVATAGTPRWNDAAIYAKKVIESGYTLCPKFRQLFMADNGGIFSSSTTNLAPNEIILPIAADGIRTKSYGTSLFLIASTHAGDMGDNGNPNGNWGGNRARSTLVKKFFPTGTTYFPNPFDLTSTLSTNPLHDDRSLFFLGKTIKSVAGKDSILPRTLNISSNVFTAGYSVIKFSNLRDDGKKASDLSFTDTDVPFLRLGEAYLTYAEAILRGGTKVNGYEALTSVNELHKRAAAKLLTTLTLQSIIDERAKEFFFEGHRRSDLIRFGQYGGVNSTYQWEWKGEQLAGTNFDSHFNLFPIPSSEINANSKLDQNPGY
ncbi:MAG: RagB/SusD family nutrient uptake outer membrane protein [Paludibacter sp.]